MKIESRDSSTDLANLRRDYQAIEAPPYLATRVRAELDDRSVTRYRLRPALGVAMFAVGLLAILPFVGQRDAAPSVAPKLPSLSALSRAMPAKPAVRAPSFARIKSVKTPRLPPKPGKTRASKPETYKDTTGLDYRLKETTNEFI